MSRVEVFEDTLELTCESVTIHPIDPLNVQSMGRYPLPTLSPSGLVQPTMTPVVVLENSYLQVTFAPNLGGRMLHCFDRRTQANALPKRDELRLSPDWDRGAGLPDGLQVLIGRSHQSLGPVDCVVREWEDGSASFIAQGLEIVDGISWHATWTLAPDAARISLDFRGINRTMEPVPAKAGLHFGGAQGHWEGDQQVAIKIGGIIWHVSVDIGGRFVCSTQNGSEAAWYVAEWLVPHQTLSFRVDLTPFSNMTSPVALSRHAAMSLSDEAIRVQSAQATAAKLYLLTRDDQTLESSVNLVPEAAAEFDLKGLEGSVVKAALIDSAGKSLAESDLLPLSWDSLPFNRGRMEEAIPIGPWREWTKFASYRAAGWYEGALVALREKDWNTALDRLDDALLYAGDDHICWWLRAVVERHAGIAESPSLTNAHYLAPLEPLLRIESFLRQPPGGSDPSTIIRPIGANGDALVEGAIRYIEASLDDDAMRWIDEALRHQDLAMLRYLAAWRLGMGAGKTAEAAIHVKAAEGLPSDLPLPFRHLEIRCIDWLTNRFPDSERLKSLSALCRAPLEVTDQ